MKAKRLFFLTIMILATLLVSSSCNKNNEPQNSELSDSGNSSFIEQSVDSENEENATLQTYENIENSKIAKEEMSGQVSNIIDTSLITDKKSLNYNYDFESATEESSNGNAEGSLSTLTVEQDKEIRELENNKYHGKLSYLRAVTKGEIDPETPKLTLEDVKSIIKSSEKVQNIIVRVKDEWGTLNENLRFEYIKDEIKKIQKYPDNVTGSGSTELEYWLWYDENSRARKEIVLYYNGSLVTYEEMDEENRVVHSELLYEIPQAINLYDTKSYPVLTRPIDEADYFKKYI